MNVASLSVLLPAACLALAASIGVPTPTTTASPASFATFGGGCPGSAGTPALAAAAGSLPQIGSTFRLDLTNLPPGLRLVVGALGFSDATWQGLPLPRDLAALGMPGCTQYVAVDATWVRFSVLGFTTWPIPIPAVPSLAGLTFYVQAVVPDPGNNPFGATVTNAGAATIGT
jgi:hypothetical protein